MAGVINTGSHPKALWPGVKGWYGVGYGEHPLECLDLFDSYTSDQNYEEDVQMIGMGLAPVKAEGQSVTYDTMSQGYVSRYVHIAYSLGFIVTYEELMDNLYEKVAGSRAKALGFSMRQTKETVGANIYNRAFDSNYTGGDGTELCATDHSTTSGDQSNELAVAADMSESSIEDLCIQIMNATDDKGLKISLMPKTLHIPPALAFEAERILNSVLQNDTANNAINAIRSLSAIPGGAKVNHYFTDTDAWFIRTNCPDGMKMYQRDSYDLKEDNDFDTDNLKAKSYDRYSFKWTDWRGVYGSPGA